MIEFQRAPSPGCPRYRKRTFHRLWLRPGIRGLGADIALTYSGEKAQQDIEPLAKALEAPIFLPCDVRGRKNSKGGHYIAG
jgi:hypothetical protein